ncbi:hypothetical protein [Dyadobacter sp. CY343]|uniref:hypothetical protein n=1 Tax=Dyadobacter sp. CY343 TaxID=2907299 RepID=UPI001F2FBA8A|nr:hypothetical protein [Dyadobacter sp. CY343]MCE7063195.1 hypothetical protein [Dyadobacter sp. CY343]
MKLNPIVFTLIFFSVMSSACNSKKSDSEISSEVGQQSIAVLRQVLATQKEWVKVHAAEYLIWAGHPEGVREAYLEEEKLWSTKPQYRIGIWRVLAQVAENPADKKIWTNKILDVFLDSSATDRTHAAETLAKLKISPYENNILLTEATLKSPVKPLALYTLWSTAFTSADSMKSVSEHFLKTVTDVNAESADRLIPAYALRQLKGISEEESAQLAEAALAEPADSPARIYLLSAAFTNMKGNSAQSEKLHAEIVKYANSPSKGNISEIAAALAEKGNVEDISILTPLLTHASQLESEADRADVAAAAAHAILKINQRE